MDDFDIDEMLKEKPSPKSKIEKFGKKKKKKAITSMIIMLIITYLLWDYRTLNLFHLGFLSYLLYPIKMFTVFLHEMSHGLMAVINGGQITQIHFDPHIGGYCAYKINPTIPKLNANDANSFSIINSLKFCSNPFPNNIINGFFCSNTK